MAGVSARLTIALRGGLGRRSPTLRRSGSYAGVLTESQFEIASAMRGPCLFPEHNFGARNDQRHVALELVQGLAFEPISGLAGLWRAGCSHGVGFCRRIALTRGDRQSLEADIAACAYAPAPVGSAWR